MVADDWNKIAFPAALIEEPGNPLTGIRILRAKRDFFAFSRLPKAGKYLAGCIFDSRGNNWYYSGMEGFLLPVTLAQLLEILILPALIFEISKSVLPCGPKIVTNVHLTIEGFKSAIEEKAKPHATKPQLRRLRERLEPCTTEEEVIIEFEAWIYGQRNKS